jgi:hypothetical protein
MSRKNKEKPDKKICLKCLKPKDPERDFYQSFSKWHTDGRVPFCKSCLKENLDENDINSVREVLRMIDRPYFHEMWEKAKESQVDTLGKYLKDLALNFKEETYDDSDFIKNEVIMSSNSNLNTDEDLVKKWGKGFSESDYEYLENFYADYANSYATDTPVQVNLYKSIAKVHLQAEKELANGNIKAFKDLMELSSKLHNDGNIKPIQSTGANDDRGLSTYGLWIREIEKEEPCEYFEKRPVYEDFDKFKKYIDNWFVRPFKNIFNLSRDFDIKEDD